MSSGPISPAQPSKDFFVSYTGRDRRWAEWIAFTLEEAGYTTIIQAWDSRPGMNVVAMMNDATRQTERTIAVLSRAYLESEFGFAEWAAAFRRDPTGNQRRLVPVRIEACDVQGLLGSIVSLDLVGLDEARAKEQLLAGVKPERAKPLSAGFPRSASSPKSGALVLERPLFPPSLPPRWNIPYPRNPYFLGREEVLDQLTAALRTGQPIALSQPAKDIHLQAISGLGGIGKTHVALEYAYRYRSDYQAVLWVQADTYENLTSSLLALAALLDLPEKEAQESAQVVAAVQRWLQMTSGYLLILDNADDLTLARDFLPTKTSGHVLLTTRAQAAGRFAHRLEVDELPTEQGMLLLLRRAGLLIADAPLEQAKESDRVIAKRLCEELGGLPLALDQAGAYIEETACGLAKYEHRYRRQRSKVLAERREALVKDHPLPVATTWNLSFEQVAQRNPVAADLLRVCAFLAPDAIPETIITEGASQLGPRLAELGTDADGLDQAVETLRAYSLVRRDAAQETLSVHRLVQAVLRDQMAQEEQRQWAERVVRATNAAFPAVEHRTWSPCEMVLPHALVMAGLIQQYGMTMPEAARLLNQAALYLKERARYPEAEPLYERALAIVEQQLGAEHPDTANSLNNLAALYYRQGKYAEAEPLYVRALAIYEQQLGAEHPNTATSLNNLAELYRSQGKYALAEPLYVRALAIREQQLGAEHPDTANSLNSLAALYYRQGKYAEAEPLYVRALAIYEQQLGAEHPDTANSLNNLAALYDEQGKYGEAKPVRSVCVKP